MDSLRQDVRLALRTLWRSPGFALAAVGTLALALGVNSSLFSVLNAVLLEALPYAEPDRVVFLDHSYPTMSAAASPPLFMDYRRTSRAFSSVSASLPWNANLTEHGEPERLRGLLVSSDFFETLGVRAARGRTFRREEEEPGREQVVVVSHELWQRRFGGEPGVVGSSLRLNGRAYQVVGVMPPGFRWGRGWGREARGDVWAPFALLPRRTDESNRGNQFLDVYARLAPGVSFAQAESDLAGVAGGLAERFPDRYGDESGWRVRLVPLQESIVGELRPALLLLQLAVAVLLFIAATNVAGLLLARAAGRRREASIRAALGASRGRLVRQLLTESAVIALLAAGAGLLVARLASTLLQRIDPTLLPRSQGIGVDGRVIGFTLAAAGLAALVCGLAPAWQGARADLMSPLRSAGVGAEGGGGTLLARRGLVVAQTALATALLIGAGLLVASLAHLNAVDPGFARDHRLALHVSLPMSRYGEAPSRVAYFDAVVRSVGELPGVRSAAVMSNLPLSGAANSSSFEIAGHESRGAGPGPHGESWSASPGYFATMGIPLRSGRLFDHRDVAEAPGVVIVNESLARRYFPGESAIGKRIDFEGEEGDRKWRAIVGVVGDVRDRSLDQEPRPQLYTPYAQRAFPTMFLVARIEGDPASALAAVRAALQAVDPEQPIYDVTTVERIVEATTSTRRSSMLGLGGFAAAALLLASLGLYGLLAYSVRERRGEIGVRMALGARSGSLVGQFLAEGARLVGLGLALGLPIGAAGAGVLRSMLYGVEPIDPVTYALVAAVLVGVSLSACGLPAWRAARIDPILALRND